MRISFQTFCAFVVAPYYHTAYRIRGWGNLPRKRAATLLIANHQHDLDTNAAAIRILLQGPWSQTMYSASSRRVFEPGFMGIRVPWLERWLGTLNASKLFTWLGMLPIENELFARSVSSIAWYVRSKYGDLSNQAVFRADVLERWAVSRQQDARMAVPRSCLPLSTQNSYRHERDQRAISQRSPRRNAAQYADRLAAHRRNDAQRCHFLSHAGRAL